MSILNTQQFLNIPEQEVLTTKEHKGHPDYRPDIDGLRAVAILSVVLFHVFPTVLTGGFVGVDVFFVISGFLISSIVFKSLISSDFSFRRFYANRFRRIFPALILVLSSCYAFGWFTLLTDEYEQLGKHMAAGAGFVQNVVLWKEAGYFDTVSELKPLMHLWSLAVEEQFYLIYPALIWCAWRFRLSVLTPILILATISFWLNVNGIEKDLAKTFFLPQTRFWELMLGGALAYIQSGFSRASASSIKLKLANCLHYVLRQSSDAQFTETDTSNFLGILGLLLIVISVFALGRGQLFPGWWALLPVFGAILLIFLGPLSWVNFRILANPFMVFIGLISYPLYLWHWPLLAFARILEFGTPSLKIRFGAVALSFLLAWLTYEFVEKPFRFGKKTWMKTATLCVLMFLLGFVGYNTFQRKGYEFRYRTLVASESILAMPAPTIQDSECTKVNPEFSAAGFCQRSKPSEPNVLLLGDSHAGHLYHGLVALSTTTPLSISIIAKGGCLPFFDVASHDKGEPEGCLNLMNNALQFIENTPSIQTVVLASRGPLYLTGKGFGNALSEFKIDWKLSLHNNPDISNPKEIFRSAMRTTIKRLVDKNKNVIFVLDVPELDFDAKSCNESPLALRKSARQICAISRQAFDIRNSEYRAIVHSVLKDYPSVKIFDAAAKLCDDKMCWAKKDNVLLYGDTNHLTLRGAEYIAESLIKLIPYTNN